MAEAIDTKPVKTVIRSVQISALPELVETEEQQLSTVLNDKNTKVLLQTSGGVRSMKASGLASLVASSQGEAPGGSGSIQ